MVKAKALASRVREAVVDGWPGVHPAEVKSRIISAMNMIEMFMTFSDEQLHGIGDMLFEREMKDLPARPDEKK